MFKRITCGLLLLSSAAFAAQWNPDQLEQFNKTNICENCDLQHAIINMPHQKASLKGSNLRGIEAGSNYFNESDFSNTNLSASNLQFAKFPGATFTGANLEGANLSNANLLDADFTNANLNGADLSYSDLRGAIISQEQLQQAAKLCHAKLPDGNEGRC